MKITDISVREFETLKTHLQRLQQAGAMLQSGDGNGLSQLKETIADLESELGTITTAEIQEAFRLAKEVAEGLLSLTSGPTLNPQQKNEKLLEFQKLNANFESTILTIVTAVNNYQHPGLVNRFLLWLAKLSEKFRV